MSWEEIRNALAVAALVVAVLMLALKEYLRNWLEKNYAPASLVQDVEHLDTKVEGVKSLTLGHGNLIAENRNQIERLREFGSEPVRDAMRRQERFNVRILRRLDKLSFRLGVEVEDDDIEEEDE